MSIDLKNAITSFSILLVSNAFASDSIQFAYTFENHSIGKLVDEFSESTGIEIERRFIDQGDLKILLLESIESDTAPEVVLVPSDHSGLYRPMRFSEVDSQLTDSNVSLDNWQSAYVDGKYFGAPIIRGNHLMLYYNKRLVSSPAETWKQLINQTDEIRAKGATPVAWNFNEMYFFMPFLGAFGGWPVTEGLLTLDSTAMVQALQSYRLLSQSIPIDTSCDYDCAFQTFAAGKLAYTINGDWALKDFQNALKDDLGIAVLPAWQDKPLVPMYSTHVLVFPDNSLTGPHADSLMKFTQYMQSKEIQGRLWEEIKVFPVEESAYEQALETIDPELQPILLQLQQAKAMPSERAMSYAWGAMSKAYERFINDVLSAEDAAKLMQRLAERELAKDN
jgi:maltose-binding protein MalE